ncbi:hypothetical protein BJD99_04440 [Rhodococcus sp. 1163]|nr:hypothetical protein BJD99_04440 [Rhodococcus sp. 1163]
MLAYYLYNTANLIGHNRKATSTRLFHVKLQLKVDPTRPETAAIRWLAHPARRTTSKISKVSVSVPI